MSLQVHVVCRISEAGGHYQDRNNPQRAVIGSCCGTRPLQGVKMHIQDNNQHLFKDTKV